MMIILLAVLILAVGFIGWRSQMKKLSTGLKTLNFKPSETFSLGALADVALDRSVLDEERADAESRPLLEQNRDAPQVLERRAQLVKTWLNANLLLKALPGAHVPERAVIESSLLAQVPAPYRIDAWNQSVCVFRSGNKAVVMSSGGEKPLACAGLNATANDLVRTVSTKKLVKTHDNILAVVQTMPLL
jgi:hypothetical protein